jgi:hypothetical protein
MLRQEALLLHDHAFPDRHGDHALPKKTRCQKDLSAPWVSGMPSCATRSLGSPALIGTGRLCVFIRCAR